MEVVLVMLILIDRRDLVQIYSITYISEKQNGCLMNGSEN